MCDAEPGVECADGSIHTGRRFEIGLCWPGRLMGSDTAVLTGCCQATVEGTYLWDFTKPGRFDVAHREAILYRGACIGCGWAASNTHHDEGAAIEDALDHALAGWREVPVVEPYGFDSSTKKIDQWKHEVARIYESYGHDQRLAPGAGGVIRTLRQIHGTRSHWSNGFYDICAGSTEPDTKHDASDQASGNDQIELF